MMLILKNNLAGKKTSKSNIISFLLEYRERDWNGRKFRILFCRGPSIRALYLIMRGSVL